MEFENDHHGINVDNTPFTADRAFVLLHSFDVPLFLQQRRVVPHAVVPLRVQEHGAFPFMPRRGFNFADVAPPVEIERGLCGSEITIDDELDGEDGGSSAGDGSNTEESEDDEPSFEEAVAALDASIADGTLSPAQSFEASLMAATTKLESYVGFITTSDVAFFQRFAKSLKSLRIWSVSDKALAAMAPFTDGRIFPALTSIDLSDLPCGTAFWKAAFDVTNASSAPCGRLEHLSLFFDEMAGPEPLRTIAPALRLLPAPPIIRAFYATTGAHLEPVVEELFPLVSGTDIPSAVSDEMLGAIARRMPECRSLGLYPGRGSQLLSMEGAARTLALPHIHGSLEVLTLWKAPVSGALLTELARSATKLRMLSMDSVEKTPAAANALCTVLKRLKRFSIATIPASLIKLLREEEAVCASSLEILRLTGKVPAEDLNVFLRCFGGTVTDLAFIRDDPCDLGVLERWCPKLKKFSVRVLHTQSCGPATLRRIRQLQCSLDAADATTIDRLSRCPSLTALSISMKSPTVTVDDTMSEPAVVARLIQHLPLLEHLSVTLTLGDTELEAWIEALPRLPSLTHIAISAPYTPASRHPGTRRPVPLSVGALLRFFERQPYLLNAEIEADLAAGGSQQEPTTPVAPALHSLKLRGSISRPLLALIKASAPSLRTVHSSSL